MTGRDRELNAMERVQCYQDLTILSNCDLGQYCRSQDL